MRKYILYMKKENALKKKPILSYDWQLKMLWLHSSLLGTLRAD